jgi:uncharacterized protein YndB with AHSA1/START domain
MQVRREIEVEATPEEVWDALTTPEGRERWLEDEREVLVETVNEPHQLVWWWWEDDEPATRVEILVAPTEIGSRVVVTERVPTFPLASMAAGMAVVR